MLTRIKNLIPEPRQAEHPRRYTGRHRRPETVTPAAPVSPAPVAAPAPESDETTEAAAV